MSRGRVLQIFPYHLEAGTGGASGVRTAVESSIELTRADWDHVIVVPGPSPFQAEFEQLGVTVHTLGRRRHLVLRRGSSPLQILRHLGSLAAEVTALIAVIRRERIDLVHTHSSAYLGGLVAARLTRRPAVVHVHERFDAISPRRAGVYRRIVSRLATRVVVIAEFMTAEWNDAGASIVYVPNTSTLAPQPAGSGSGAVVGFVGRIAPRKGLEFLLRAFRLVHAARPDTRLVVVGGPAEPEDFPYQRLLEQEARELGIDDAISFVGPSADVGRSFAGFAVLGFTSPVDIAPITLLEAMACGVPVVSASDGGAEEMVVDGKTGFVVEPRDDAAIADALLRVLGDDALREEMSLEARRRFASHYGPKRYGAALDSLYRGLLESS